MERTCVCYIWNAFWLRSRLTINSELVSAIANLEQTGVDIAGGFWSLNAYQW